MATVGTVMSALLVMAVITIVRPDKDNTVLIAAISTMVAPTIAALLALIKGQENSAAVKDLHLIVNSRLTELLETTTLANQAVGREEGAATAMTQAAIQAKVVAEAAERAIAQATAQAEKMTEVAAKLAEVVAPPPPIVPPAAGEREP